MKRSLQGFMRHSHNDFTNNHTLSYYITALLLGLALVPLGIGVFISMRIFNIPDITTDGSYTLGAALTAVLLLHHYPLPLICVVVFGAGALSGMATGFIHTRLKVNALLSGILVMTALYSVNLTFMGRSNLPLIQTNSVFDWFNFLQTPFLAKLLPLTLIVGLLWILITFLLKTDFGIAMRATGNSETMAKALGVNTNRMQVTGLGLSNGLVSLSGFLVTQYQGFADINMGIGIVVMGLGSVMIGETFTQWIGLKSSGARIAGVIAGSLIFRFILAFVLTTGIDPALLKLVTAGIVLLVVSLPQLRKVR
jgi:putative ABC transport system permease protein